MSLGAVLIRPQPLLLPDSPVTPADVIIAFAESLLKDPAAALPALGIMGEETVKAFEDLLAGLVEKMRLSDGKFRALFDPFIEPFNALVNGLGEDIPSTLLGVLEALPKLLDQLTTDKVVEFFRKLLDIVEKDLGISPATLRDLFTDLTSRMIERLQARVIGGDNSGEAVALYDFGVGLDDIQRLVDSEIQAPPFDAALLLEAIRDFWARLDLDRTIGLIHQVLDLGEQALVPLATLAQAIAEANVDASAGPAHPVAADGSEVTVTKVGPGDPNDPIAWYASWVAGVYHRLPADTALPENTYNNISLRHFTYLHVSREKMEQIAYHTTWIFDLVEAVLFHGLSIEKGDILNNLNAMVLDGVEVGLVLAKTRYPLPWWLQWFVWPLASIILRECESGKHAFSDRFGLLMLIVDAFENITYRRWTWLMRETLLSTLTLLNHDPAAAMPAVKGQKRNIDMVDGVCHAFMEVGVLLAPFILARTNRSNYGLGGDVLGGQIGIALAASLGSAMFWGFIGYLLGRGGLAGERVADSLDGGHMLRILFRERMLGNYSFDGGGEVTSALFRGLLAVITYALDHFVYLYIFTDDSTDDGRMALDKNGNGAGEFQGYPSAADSPYRLPYADTSKMCMQGNMGIWSHFPRDANGQVYAYDFAMDQGEEVVCSRSGIVVNLRDSIATNTGGPDGQQWNFVEIMHLVVIKPGDTPPPGVTPLDPVPPPAGVTKFADGSDLPDAHLFPPGILFPPYWDAAGKSILSPFAVPLHPSAAIWPPGWTPAPPYYAGFTGFPAGTKFAFLIPGHDRGLGSGAGLVLKNGDVSSTIPLAATFMAYGHGLGGFMTQSGVAGAPAPGNSIYRSSTANQVIGQYVEQGQVIMLADHTGISWSNHVHVQVSGQIGGNPGLGTGANWPIPYVYADVVHNASNGLYKAAFHNGRPRAFTTYSSGNTRVAPK